MQKDPNLKDFRNFLFLIWKHLALPDPTPVQYQIAEFLQHGPKRQVIEAFRGCGKSWITSAYVLWKLYWNYDEKILVVSASKQRADDFSTFTLKLIKEVPFLQHLAPGKDQRESKIAFDIGPTRPAHAASVKSAGIYGQITGSRATHIIADDIEVMNNSATQDMREKLLYAVAEFEAILVPEGNPRITFLGTPQTEESVYNKMRAKGYTVKIWPARYPSINKVATYDGALAEWIEDKLDQDPGVAGQPTDPGRFNAQDLIEREASYGRSGFALQFMLDTSLSDAEKYPLKTNDLIVSDLDPGQAPSRIAYGSGQDQNLEEFPRVGFAGDRWNGPLFLDYEKYDTPYEGSVMAIDPSGRGHDELGYAILKQCRGKLYLMASGGLKGGYDDPVLTKLASLAKQFQVNRIIVESNFGDGMFTKILTPVLGNIYPCTIEEVRHNIQKEARIIDTLEPVMNSHRLVVSKTVVREDLRTLDEEPTYSLFYQLTRLTRERGALKHDDRLDALAIGVAYWVDAMARDEAVAEKTFRNELLERELETFMTHAVGYNSEWNEALIEGF